MPVAYILADMEFQGAKMDKDVLKQLGDTFKGQIDQLEKKFIYWHIKNLIFHLLNN